MLSVEIKKTTQEEERRRDRGFEHVAAPAVSAAFEALTFGVGPASVKILFQMNPFAFEGTNVADGTNMPNFKNVHIAQLLKEIQQKLGAGLLTTSSR